MLLFFLVVFFGCFVGKAVSFGETDREICLNVLDSAVVFVGAGKERFVPRQSVKV